MWLLAIEVKPLFKGDHDFALCAALDGSKANGSPLAIGQVNIRAIVFAPDNSELWLCSITAHA